MMRPIAVAIILSSVQWSYALDPTPEMRGKEALERRGHLRGNWTMQGFSGLWKLWGEKEKPADCRGLFQHRYGLDAAPFPNDGLPLGLRRTDAPRPNRIVLDCMICHGGALLGESRVGLPNTTVDLTSLFQDLTKSSGMPPLPEIFPVNRTRGVTNAGALGVFFVALRNADMSRRFPPLMLGWERFPDLDAPAWWLLKKKRTMYCDGGMAADSTRSIMQFLLTPDRSLAELKAAEPVWDDIRRYILTLAAPKYPFPVNAAQAARGGAVFEERCGRCHGTYGENAAYPDRVVPIEEIGTDRARFDAITTAARNHYNSTWFGEKRPARKTRGYQAPPLDGIWATAPYFHNGSAPTVYNVLDSRSRPARFRRLDSTGADAFDTRRLGWKVEIPAGALPDDPRERRRIYDSQRFGNGIGGHTFGDSLTDEQRFAVIEYLKTL